MAASEGVPRPTVSPVLGAADLWPTLRETVPDDILSAHIWSDLEPMLPAVPGPVVGFERELASPAATEWGFPLPRWQRAAALQCADRHPAAAHLTPLVRAWLDDPDLDRACDVQLATWDIGPDGSHTPCVFLRSDSGRWREMLRGYARGLRARPRAMVGPISSMDLAHRLEEAEETTPISGVVSVGVYLGRPGCPVRFTALTAARPWPDHPLWLRVDEVLDAAHREARGGIVAFAAGADPGDVWHVPVLVDREPQPSASATPLLAALAARGTVSADHAAALGRIDSRRRLELTEATLDGVPAVATLWWSLERLKVVVDMTGWRSAKADMIARVVWRGFDGSVLVDH